MSPFKLLLLFLPLLTDAVRPTIGPASSPPGIVSTDRAHPAPEICDNGIDDDGDGFIDLFDSDCPCSLQAYQAYCPVDCEYLPDTFPDITLSLKWQSEIIVNQDHNYPNIIVGDINLDGITDVITKKFIISGGTTNGVLAFNGSNGNKLAEILSVPRTFADEGLFVSMADVDLDGLAEFFFTRQDTVVCMRQNGSVMWKSDRDVNSVGYLVNLADFNGDGIPEVYRGNTIYNARNGKMLVTGNDGAGCNLYQVAGDCGVAHTIATDLLPSPGLELAAGNTVYQITITNTNGTAGNTITATTANSPVKDGFTSVGDIDNDGQLDIIVVRNRQYANGGGVWVWNPRTRAMIASATAGITGGVAFVGNVAGDCHPEIGVNFEDELIMYQYDGTTALRILYNLNTTDGSGYTGVTMFDFNQDGFNELVYRDETFLRIMEGNTGKTLASYPIRNGTGMEYPVVADVDGDGQAEIMVSGYTTSASQQRLFCFESGGAPWAPARAVWNQPGYHVTNINDDLTIPRNPQNQATALIGYQNCLLPTCPAPYNAFMTQATFRTQEGCVQFPAADFDINATSLNCLGDSLELCFVIQNSGDYVPSSHVVGITAWSKNPLKQATIPVYHGNVTLNGALDQPDTFCLHIVATGLNTQLFITVNESGASSPFQFPQTDIIECNYLNNLDSIATGTLGAMVDAGPDLTACFGENIEIQLPGHFDWYLWSPAQAVDCDTCAIVHVLSSSAVALTVTAGNGVCAGSDTIQIDVITPPHVDADTILCNGSLFDFQDSLITSPGDYSFQATPCDTSFTWHVAFSNADTTWQSISLCFGDSVFFHGTWLSDAGIYFHTASNMQGCDSIIQLDLQVAAFLSTTSSQTLCQGDSAWIYDQWVYGAGIYLDTLAGTNCDTIATTTITMASAYDLHIDRAICPGDSLWLVDHWAYASEMVQEQLISVDGCDSIITTNLVVPLAPAPPQWTVQCDPPLTTAVMADDPAWSYTWDDGSVSTSKTYHSGGPGYLIARHIDGCQLRYDFTVADIPDPGATTWLQDTTILEHSALPINLPLSPEFWKVVWSPADIFSCDTCLSTIARPTTHTQVHADLMHSSGCTYLIDFTVDLERVVVLYIPNIFSPNDDQINDTWIVQSPGDRLLIVEAFLFDRWGNEIRSWSNLHKLEWDGLFRGQRMNPGVFTYTLQYLDQTNTKQRITGDVTLVR